MTNFNDIDNLLKMTCDFTKLFKSWEAELSSIHLVNQEVILSCSGGLDSTVLFYLFLEFKKFKKNFSFSVIHFNFKLRGEESDLDQRFVEGLSRANCINIKSIVVTDADFATRPGKSVQEWARAIRYATYRKLIHEKKIIALAHHRDDLAENFLLRLARGKNLGHIAGMTNVRGSYWRPLLGLRKNALKAWVGKFNLVHREDATNAKIDYSRNKIRHEIIPGLEATIPGATQNLINAAMDWQEWMAEYRKQLTRELEILDSQGKAGWIPTDYLLAKSPLLSLEALNVMLAKRCPSKKFRGSRAFFKQLRDKLESSKNSKKQWSFNLARGLILKFDGGFFNVLEEKTAQKQIRFLQHRRNLSQRLNNALLAPGANVEFY